ncbi:unnamed protein product [Zymoseptoria tritici ST99CH_1E4]|uniref:FAR1 domain-containing protein n=1 Tax=Zymoseptoria tritici ST99CH_1E4 TaxID=1276532 RepID=A0A2H1G3J9_ZYMTR|nr:unnamed protein product [Zymoseptoria tritici ST99CH_1E4]
MALVLSTLRSPSPPQERWEELFLQWSQNGKGGGGADDSSSAEQPIWTRWQAADVFDDGGDDEDIEDDARSLGGDGSDKDAELADETDGFEDDGDVGVELKDSEGGGSDNVTVAGAELSVSDLMSSAAGAIAEGVVAAGGVVDKEDSDEAISMDLAPPPNDRTFRGYAQAIKYTQDWAQRHGYSLAVGSSKKSKKADSKYLISKALTCSRGGRTREGRVTKGSRPTASSAKCGCGFALTIGLVDASDPEGR